MVARVADGDTIVIAGLGRDRETRARKSVTTKRVELVVLVTPRIVPLP
jgi:type II secretory pathway component GspD/PulD (secretin)